MSYGPGLSAFIPTKHVGPPVDLIPITIFPREPAGTDKKYPIGQVAIIGKNPSSGSEGDLWYLASFTSGVADWRILSASGGSLTDLRDQVNVEVSPTDQGYIDIDGSTVANGANPSGIPLETVAGTHILTIQQQVAADITGAPADKNDAGIASFNDTQFVVDANGYVSLAGGSDLPGIQTLTSDDPTIVGPDGSGNIDLTGETVANATNAKPVFVDAGTNALNVEVQVAAAITGAPADKNDAGLCSFDDTNFAVTANGYVTFTGSGGVPAATNGQALTQTSGVLYITPANVGYLQTATNITFTQMPYVETTANTAIEPGTGNGEVNLLMFQGGDIANEFFIGAKTIVRPEMDTTGLLVSLDLTDNEGVEYNWGARSNAKHIYTIGTSPAFYCQWEFTLADVTGCDPVGIGFRKVEANNAVLESYTDFVFIGVSETDNSGTVTIKTRLNSGAVTNTNTTDTWADGETHTLKVLVSAAGVVTYTIDGIAPSVTAAFTFDNTDEVMPYFHGLHGTTTPGTWHWQSCIIGVQ